MAIATNEKVERIILEEGVVLRLTRDEADFLADILDRVGGNPEKSRRRYQHEISDALVGAGIRGTSYGDVSATEGGPGSIYFTDKDGKVFSEVLDG